MCELMRHDLSPCSIPFDDRGGEEHHPGVLHASIGEARWQHEQIEPLPFIRPKEALPNLDHLLHPRELPSRLVQHLVPSLRVHPRPRAEVPGPNPAGGEREEVGRHGLLHLELLNDAAGRAPQLVVAGPAVVGGQRVPSRDVARGGDGGELLGHVEEEREGDARGGGVVAGEDGAGVDGLALREDEGLPGGGLRRGQPLQRGGGGGGGEGEPEGGGVGGQGEGERRAEDRVGRRGEGEGDGLRRVGIGGGGVDGEGTGVEEEIPRVRRGEGEQRGGVYGGGGEVEVEGERGARHHRVRAVGVGVGIDRRHGCSLLLRGDSGGFGSN